MSKRLLLVAAVLVLCIALVSAEAKVEDHETKASDPTQPPGLLKVVDSRDCEGLCRARCSLHSRPNRCNRACGTCCVRCRCVPPGTSGNREACGPCYTNMTTHGQRLKCP